MQDEEGNLVVIEYKEDYHLAISYNNEVIYNVNDYQELDGSISLKFFETNQIVNDIIENLIEVLKNIERQYPKNLKIKIAKV